MNGMFRWLSSMVVEGEDCRAEIRRFALLLFLRSFCFISLMALSLFYRLSRFLFRTARLSSEKFIIQRAWGRWSPRGIRSG